MGATFPGHGRKKDGLARRGSGMTIFRRRIGVKRPPGPAGTRR